MTVPREAGYRGPGLPPTPLPPGGEREEAARIAQLEADSQALAEQVATDWRASLQQALRALLGSDEAADQALAAGVCLLEGGTLAWRLDLATLVVELFCDIGLPAPADTQEAWRLALEANLCRRYPGVSMGLHPESGRLVATACPPAVLMLDEAQCQEALQTLAGHARALRESLGLALDLGVG